MSSLINASVCEWGLASTQKETEIIPSPQAETLHSLPAHVVSTPSHYLSGPLAHGFVWATLELPVNRNPIACAWLLSLALLLLLLLNFIHVVVCIGICPFY